MEEKWKEVDGFPKYKVSNLGRVVSYQSGLEKELRPAKAGGKTSKYGYYFVVLCNNGLHKIKPIHLLVYEHFGEGKRDGRWLVVDHIDGDKTNNAIYNLQILTSQENAIKRTKQHQKQDKIIGVIKKGRRWHAQIKQLGVRYSYSYKTYEEAVAKRIELEEIFFPKINGIDIKISEAK